MEHINPLLEERDTAEKFITIGELMLRLTPPNYEKICVTTSFEASYGGSEANITDDVSAIRNLMNMNYDIKR